MLHTLPYSLVCHASDMYDMYPSDVYPTAMFPTDIYPTDMYDMYPTDGTHAFN